jgi:hypothetical protein
MANAWGNYVYVYGGTDFANKYLRQMIRLDVANMTAGWSKVVPAPAVPGDTTRVVARYHGVSATLSGVFYYVGGWDIDGTGGFVRTVSSYNPATNIFTRVVNINSLPDALADAEHINHCCLVALGDSLYYMRYQYLLRWKPCGELWWTAITTSSPWANIGYPSCAAYDGKVVQMSGSGAATYDPVTGAFERLPDSQRGHYFPVAGVCSSPTDPKGKRPFHHPTRVSPAVCRKVSESGLATPKLLVLVLERGPCQVSLLHPQATATPSSLTHMQAAPGGSCRGCQVCPRLGRHLT